MSYNGSGTFVINSTGQPVVTGTVISSTAFNALTADLATGLSTALTKDGQTTPTANLPMGTFKFTGMGAGSAATDSANIAQVQNSFGSFLTVSGTDTITATVSPALTAYATGQMFAFLASNTNTGAVTINISSLGAKAITKNGNTALVASDLTANYLYVIVYDGTQFQVVGVSATTFANLTITGVLTLSGAGVQMSSSGTGAWKMPVGTTGQRPTGAQGLIRLNSTTGNPEWYDASSSAWLTFSQNSGYTISYLVVAGGAGGGAAAAASAGGGGGGAGGLLSSTASLTSGTAYTITIGAGGAGGLSSGVAAGSNGSTSSIATIATASGGGGGSTSSVSANSTSAAAAGGSGGGGSNYYPTPGSGVSGQGFAGGTGSTAGSNFGGGGGGGASAVGVNGSGGAGGAGGAGSANAISGASVTYAGGGGAGTYNGGTTGSGGAGGGGAGGTSTGGTGVAGTANLGGGGGGASSAVGNSYDGGAGGAGVVIISYLGSQRGTGGTVTSSGGYTIHTFTSSSTYNA